jgi:hypothetical protein
VETLLAERPLDRLRSVQALLRLEQSVGRERLEAASQRALYYGDPRYRRIKDILNAALDLQPLPLDAFSRLSEPRPARQFAFARSVEEFFALTEVER